MFKNWNKKGNLEIPVPVVRIHYVFVNIYKRKEN